MYRATTDRNAVAPMGGAGEHGTMMAAEASHEASSRARELHETAAAGLRTRGLLAGDAPLAPESFWPERHGLFEAIDLIYLFHLLGLWTEARSSTVAAWWQCILAGQSATDGWFRGQDRQRHSPVHVTAYALGALCILRATDSEATLAATVRPPADVRLLGRADVGELSAVERLHFWRGSHRVGGMLAIAAMLNQLGRTDSRVPDWPAIRACVEDWMATADATHGGWTLGHPIGQWLFDRAFAPRHRPEHCRIGAAAHLYWPAVRLAIPGPRAEPVIEWLAGTQDAAGRFEQNPYCLDYDALCIGEHVLRHDAKAPDHTGETLRSMAATSRNNLIRSIEDGRIWARGLHGLVGAVAALGCAERILQPVRPAGVAEPLEHAWWL